MVRGPMGRGFNPLRALREVLRPVAHAVSRTFPRTWTLLVNNRVLLVTVVLVALSGILLNRLFGGNLLQVVVNGMVIGSIYVLGATGLSLTYGIKKFANFAHGDMLTLGAYMAFFVNVGLGFHLVLGFLFAIAALAAVGIALEILIFSRLEGKGVIAPLIASIGVFIVIQNSIGVVFTTEIFSYNIVRPRNWIIGDPPFLSINPVKGVATFVVAVAVTALLHVLLSRTTLGKAMRATSDNVELARSSGINTRNIALWTWAIAGMLAAVGGVLLAVVIDVRPLLGFNILLFLFAAVIIGGIGSPYGAMIGGFLVGVIQELSGILLDWLGRPDVIGLDVAAAYRPVAAFLVMILVLLVRPEGLMGTATRKDVPRVGLWARITRR